MFRRGSKNPPPAQPAAVATTNNTSSSIQSNASNNDLRTMDSTNSNEPMHFTATSSNHSLVDLQAVVAAEQNPPPVPVTSSPSRRASVKPVGFSLPPIGIDATEDPEFADQPRLTGKDVSDPEVVADKLNRLTELVQEISVKSRDNNSILCQMLFMLEERMNRRIDLLKEEMTALVEKKFQVLQMELQNSPTLQAPPRGRRQSSHSRSGGNLGAIFEAVDSQDTSSQMSAKTSSLTIPAASVAASNGSGGGVTYENKNITPIPGFVIKTHKLIGDKEKVFINVFYHELIEVVPSNLPKGSNVEAGKPFLVMGQITRSLDSNGRNCSTFNVGVSSDYFKPGAAAANDFKITAPSSIQKIIHKINLKNNEFFDENSYSLPRLANGFKGEEILPMAVPVPATAKPPAEPLTKSGRNFPTSGPPAAAGNGKDGSPSGAKLVTRSSFNDDNESVISELTTDRRDSDVGRSNSFTDKRPARKMTRKSIFDTSQLAINAGNIAGRNLLSGNMCEYIKEESVDGTAAEQLKEASIVDPHVLLGWQISLIMENGDTEIMVVTDVRKNYLSKTEFRVSRFFHDDQWVKLKRNEGKSGQEFRPLRKVLFGLTNDDESVI